jgi:PAS domain S-box-containing protein
VALRSPGGVVARAPLWLSAASCLIGIAVIGAADFHRTVEGVATLLYLLPVAVGGWLLGRSYGLALAGVATVTSVLASLPELVPAKHIGDVGILVMVALLVGWVKEGRSSEHATQGIIEGILDAIPIRVFWKDTSLVFLGCNRAFARDAGFSDPTDVVGKDDHQMAWRDRAESYRDDDRKVIESGRPKLLIEELRTTPDGRLITLLTSKVPLLDAEGKVSGVLGTYLDISERKRAEQASLLLATAVDQAAESIVITDASGSILYTNPAFERTTGYSSEEVLGQNPRLLKSGKQDDDFYRQMWTVLSDGGVWSGRIINKRKDGTLFEEDATISPVRDAAGRILNYVAVKRDVSKESRLEQQLFQAQKIDAIGRLAGGVAHDFNNLLGVITGYGEVVFKRLPPDDSLKSKMRQVLKAAERAAGLTRQLLAFSRKQVLQPRILDLNSVVADMDDMLRRVIGEDVQFTTRMEPRLGSVRADPAQVEQIIMNLVVNARDAMPEGGTLTIETRNADLEPSYTMTHPPTRPGLYVMLSISDTGAGMDDATQARIFEPFFTTKEAGRGTGLGLATVYGIVKQSGGYIWAYSEVGVGTTFKVYFPRIDEEALLPPVPEHGPIVGGSETVLLVEDESSLRELLREVLETNGYMVLAARDGSEALRIAGEHVGLIEMMVTDVIMPGMTGPRIADLIAPSRPTMKVLFISGYSDQSATRHGLVGPGRAFLSKPFGAEALLRHVRQSLDSP